MEINGLANIHIIIDGAKEGEVSPELAEKIKEQLETLNRYLINIATECQKKDVRYAPWHEVRDNPTKYPTLHEKIQRRKA